MHKYIRVADIKIVFSGKKFFEKISPYELEFLKPFIIEGRSSSVFKGDTVFCEFRILKKQKSILPKRDMGIEKKLCNAFPVFAKTQKRQTTWPYVSKRWIPVLSANKMLLKNILRKESYVGDNLCGYYCGKDKYKVYMRPFTYEESKFLAHSRERSFWLGVPKMAAGICLGVAEKGLLLHASSVAIGKRGFIFLGPSNSGKSTMAKLVKPNRILSDETALVIKRRSGYWLYPNPWWNAAEKEEILQPFEPVRLSAIFFLKKDQKTSFRRLGFIEALAGLVYGDTIFQQNECYIKASAIKSFYTQASDMLSEVPAFQFNARKEKSVAEKFRLINR